MGFSSAAGQVVFRKQTVLGTYAADIATAGTGIKLRGGTLGPNRDLLITDPEMGGTRDVTDAYLGAASWSGDYDFYARPDMMSTLLFATLGVNTPVTTTGHTVNTITPSDAASLPYYSIEERVGAAGSSLEVFNYTDAVVNTFHLECDANGYLMGTVSFIGAKQTAGNTATASPPYDNGFLFVGTNIAITYNAVALPAKSFSLDINNNFEDDDFRLGSFYLGDLTPKRREITASFHIREASNALWRQAVYGTSAATAVGGVTTKQQLVITCTTYENILTGTPVTPATVVFTIPKFIFKPYAFGVNGDDIIEDDLEGQAVRPAVGTAIMTCVVTSDKATVS